MYLKEHQIVTFSKNDLLTGIYNATWKGRFEIVNKEPLIIVDGAHNKEESMHFTNVLKIR